MTITAQGFTSGKTTILVNGNMTTNYFIVTTYLDINGVELAVGKRVAVAFADKSHRGYIRTGIIEEINSIQDIKVRWDKNNQLSPKMHYNSANRWVVL